MTEVTVAIVTAASSTPSRHTTRKLVVVHRRAVARAPVLQTDRQVVPSTGSSRPRRITGTTSYVV